MLHLVRREAGAFRPAEHQGTAVIGAHRAGGRMNAEQVRDGPPEVQRLRAESVEEVEGVVVHREPGRLRQARARWRRGLEPREGIAPRLDLRRAEMKRWGSGHRTGAVEEAPGIRERPGDSLCPREHIRLTPIERGDTVRLYSQGYDHLGRWSMSALLMTVGVGLGVFAFIREPRRENLAYVGLALVGIGILLLR